MDNTITLLFFSPTVAESVALTLGGTWDQFTSICLQRPIKRKVLAEALKLAGLPAANPCLNPSQDWCFQGDHCEYADSCLYSNPLTKFMFKAEQRPADLTNSDEVHGNSCIPVKLINRSTSLSL